MKNYELSRDCDGRYLATLKDGISIGAAAETPESAADDLIGYLRDIVNERNAQLNSTEKV